MIPAAYRGVNLHPIWYPDAKIDQLCQILSTSRVQQVRIDFPFNWLLPAQGACQPTYLERLTRFVSECPPSIEVLGVLCYAPKWANGGGAYNMPWTLPADFAAAVSQIVQAFPAVAAWEVWNEPDQDYSWAHATGSTVQRATAYVKLLEVAYPAIKAASPSAKVVAPATSGTSAAPWLGAFYASDPRGLYDVVSAHVYGDPPSHGSLAPVDAMQAWAASIWPLIASNGDGLAPLWITETGWNTSPTGVTVDQQAAALTGVFQQIDQQVPSVRRVYWYEMLDDRSGTVAPNDYYGLLDVNLAQKGDGSAWAAFNALP